MNEYDDMIDRLKTIRFDAPPHHLCTIDDAIELFEKVRDQRTGWKCTAGGETFVTYDQSVAEEWIKDELVVEKFFA
jgi:hypothetical protein